MNALPAILWIIGAGVAVLVCAITAIASHYHDGRDAAVRPVNWSVIIGHFVSFVVLAAAYVVYLANRGSMSEHSRVLYAKLGWPSAAVAVALVAVELVLMYLQARRAMLAQEATTSATRSDEGRDDAAASDARPAAGKRPTR